MPYLLNTNILSELRRGQRCDPKVAEWAHSTRADRHCISVLSLGEIHKSIELLRRKSPQQRPAFENWLLILQTEYETDILPITDRISDQWGHMMAQQTLPVIDGLLAATALAHGLTIATRNVTDFEHSRANVVNPFET